MDINDIWDKLRTISIHVDASISPFESDKATARKLNEDHIEDDWESVYVAVNALERGRGYPNLKELEELCKTACVEDDKKLLRIIEQKPKLLETILLLLNVNLETKLAWIDSGAIETTPVLFECLRQVLKNGVHSEWETDTIIKGLCSLMQLSSERFRYLLNSIVLYRDDLIPVVSGLLECIPENGWAVLSQCISFDDVDSRELSFWDKYTDELDWDVVHYRAEPLLETWETYIVQSLSGRNRQSLYCDVSNVLIAILVNKLNTLELYTDAMERTIHMGEMAMFRWYERETQQFGAMAACLSVVGHLRYVWINNSETYAKPFPEDLCRRGIALISQSRYLWASHLRASLGEEVTKLYSWFKSGCIELI